jgi:hypothetical protein
MRRLRNVSGTAKAAVCALLLAAALPACGEDGKTAPERCADPPLPIFDIQRAGAPHVENPCVTQPGFAISDIVSNDAAAGSGGT